MNSNDPTFGFLIHHGLPPLNGFQRAPLYSQARNSGGEMRISWLPSYMWESQKICRLRILEQGQLSLFHLTEKKKWNGIFTFSSVLLIEKCRWNDAYHATTREHMLFYCCTVVWSYEVGQKFWPSASFLTHYSTALQLRVQSCTVIGYLKEAEGQNFCPTSQSQSSKSIVRRYS